MKNIFLTLASLSWCCVLTAYPCLFQSNPTSLLNNGIRGLKVSKVASEGDPLSWLNFYQQKQLSDYLDRPPEALLDQEIYEINDVVGNQKFTLIQNVEGDFGYIYQGQSVKKAARIQDWQIMDCTAHYQGSLAPLNFLELTDHAGDNSCMFGANLSSLVRLNRLSVGPRVSTREIFPPPLSRNTHSFIISDSQYEMSYVLELTADARELSVKESLVTGQIFTRSNPRFLIASIDANGAFFDCRNALPGL